MNIGRFQFTPPWKLTRWGFLPECMFRTQLGCDEWHNKSRYWTIPFVGQVVVFAKGMTRTGPWHLHSCGVNGQTEGYIDPTCDICDEIAEWFAESRNP